MDASRAHSLPLAGDVVVVVGVVVRNRGRLPRWCLLPSDLLPVSHHWRCAREELCLEDS